MKRVRFGVISASGMAESHMAAIREAADICPVGNIKVVEP